MQNFELQFELGTKCFKFYQEILRLTENDRGFCLLYNTRNCSGYKTMHANGTTEDKVAQHPQLQWV